MSIMDDPTEIFKNCVEKEKHLHTLRQNPKINCNEIALTAEILRNSYRKIILASPNFPKLHNKDIQGSLWKQGFYKRIEEFRSSIQKTIHIIEGNVDTTVILQEKAKIHLIKLSSSFFNFLTDSLQFYQDFFLELEIQYSTSSTELKEYILSHLHRISLYMGDLARYKELYSENKTKEYSIAIKYYQRAAELVPSSGNPQNQLAVLAIYSKAEINAVYHYCRVSKFYS